MNEITRVEGREKHRGRRARLREGKLLIKVRRPAASEGIIFRREGKREGSEKRKARRGGGSRKRKGGRGWMGNCKMSSFASFPELLLENPPEFRGRNCEDRLEKVGNFYRVVKTFPSTFRSFL